MKLKNTKSKSTKLWKCLISVLFIAPERNFETVSVNFNRLNMSNTVLYYVLLKKEKVEGAYISFAVEVIKLWELK